MHSDNIGDRLDALQEEFRAVGATVITGDSHLDVFQVIFDNHDGGLAGFVCHESPNVFYLELIEAYHPYRGTGVARRLIGCLLTILDRQKMRCTLSAEQQDSATMPYDKLVAWYRRLGFKITNKSQFCTKMHRKPQSTQPRRKDVS
jgi:GNAT superfamily N-acetyltransferase